MSDSELSEVGPEQVLKYAEEISKLYSQERESRKELQRAYEKINELSKQLESENNYLREEVKCELAFGAIIGECPATQRMLQEIKLFSETDATVLILGETGSGKELVARAIHEQSARNKHLMIKVNCGAVPRELFESEFFGHIKGSFTGAIKDREGRFQLANKSTLFLDEIGEVPLDLQVKILRVLQEGQFEPIGSEKTKSVDVRIIAATNRSLKKEVEEGRFREDLYYRLSVIPLHVPPLRERKEDIELLASHFISQACKRLNKNNKKLTKNDLQQFQSYDWPGNIREMQNVIERAVILSTGEYLNFDFSLSLAPDLQEKPIAPTSSILSEKDRKKQERGNIMAALEKTNWKVYGKRGAGELLGIQPATLAYKIKTMDIKKPA